MNTQSHIHGRSRPNGLTRLKHWPNLLVAIAVTLAISSTVWAQASPNACGTLDNGSNGPFDYRTERGHKLKAVEQFHFTTNVENLIQGSSTTLGGDLNYTLTVFPNHHRALIAIMRLGELLKSPQPTGARYSVECYFERALRFRPDDTTARMIYATFLAKVGREAETIKQLEYVSREAGDNPFTHYNIGLIYFDIKRYDQALIEAHKAYALGFLQPALRDQLRSAGKWQDSEAQLDAPKADLENPDAAAKAEKN